VAPSELLIDAERANFAPAAAVAAALHHPDRQLICVTTTEPALDVIERLGCSIVTVNLGPMPTRVGGMATVMARDEATLRATVDRFIRQKRAALIDASTLEG